MTETSVKDQIRKLVDLQKLDEEIYSLQEQLKEKPAIVEELKNGFESKKGHLLGLEESLKAVQLKRKEYELDLKGKEDEITRANAKLSEIKTNKEYTAKISEIEHIKADKSRIEEQILVSYDEADAVNAKIEAEKKVVAEEERNYLAKKKEAEDDTKVVEDRIKVLRSQRSQIAPGLDKNSLSRYEKILANKGGLAIVPVRSNACGGCFMNVTPQMVNALRMHDQLIVCEMCSRLLYLEEDL